MFLDTPCICIPFFSNNNTHQSDVNIIGMYLHFINGTHQVINFEHPDSLQSDVTLHDIELHPHSLVLNKKAMIYAGFDFGLDLNSYIQYYIDDYVDIVDFYPKTLEHFYSKMYKSTNISKIIPLSKLIEFAENVVMYTLPHYNVETITEKCISYCNDFLSVFHSIEKHDICVGDAINKQNYMWYTATSRPSNSWHGFNFSSLNKTDGSRDLIHSKFKDGKILQFDYDAFHIKLLSKILEYDFLDHPYVQIKNELNLKMDYDQVKSRVFQNLYGGISDEFLLHPFFLQVQAVIEELYSEYKNDGFIESWFYNKKFIDIESATPNKVFNYFLQSLETEYNVMKIKTLLPLLESKESCLMMYMYDAFIFDIHPDEMDLIPILQRVFETDNMTIKMSIGTTFGNMTRI